MNPVKFIRVACIGAFLLAAPLGADLHAASFAEFVDPNPAAGNQFGASVIVLSTGNVAITSPFDDAGGADAGAAYLFNGTTGALISTLRGSSANDNVGSFGLVALANGNYLVRSPNWDNGAAVDAGAVTWANGVTGVAGTVSAANSLVGSSTSDQVGGTSVAVLPSGNYVIRSYNWNNGAIVDAGAATWGNGLAGVSGAISAANSLVGSTAGDQVGSVNVTVLTNGNYVVRSPSWDNGATVNVGAVTWGNGLGGVTGAVSAANSLVGSTANDVIGDLGVTVLANGNYVVASSLWNNGATVDAGAATWGNGALGTAGAISAANSLVGSTASDNVSGAGGPLANGVTALTNGNYVVRSQNWNNGAVVDAGAATWGNGATGVAGVVSAANSLVGSTANDLVGSSGLVALTNGNYVVRSTSWDNGAITNAGAATWGNGATGTTGALSAANSLVGSTVNDGVGGNGVTALTNGNYVVFTTGWDNGAVVDVGAATWGNGATGITGAVSTANSLVGSTAGDNVGSVGVTALANGHYVVRSPNWDNGAITNAGAATWGNGAIGTTGTVSVANSLVGSSTGDNVSGFDVSALTNGNYVIRSTNWDNGGIVDAGAATWGNGAVGSTGVVSAANSLVGSTTNDHVGNGIRALTNGDYLILSPNWDNGATVDAGAATWGSGTASAAGALSAANSVVGSTGADAVGFGAIALTLGGYAILSPSWDNGATVNAGAMTVGFGAMTGAITGVNSVVGATANTALLAVALEDSVSGTVVGLFQGEGGSGHVRVASSPRTPTIVSAADVPSDQGGWLRVTFNRSAHDDASAWRQATTYGVWRHVPGTFPARAREGAPSTLLDARGPGASRLALSPEQVKRMGAAFPPGTWELVTSVPAIQRTQYVVAVPTVSNAAANDFLVTVHTASPSTWYASDIVTAQSLDNLAPAAPTSFAGAYAGGQTNLSWAANGEHDLGSYRLYRGASADFTPAIGNLIATPASTAFADVGPAGGFYKLSAVDVNGNESGFALVTPDGTTGVAADAVAFALDGVRPNPASGQDLHVAFALPSGHPARLELIDLSGRRVLGREIGSLGAGRHVAHLAANHRVAPGVYWVRLTQGENQRSVRVAVR